MAARRRTRSGREAGFAVLAALLVLVGVAALAVAGFFVSGTDLRTSTSHRMGTRARLLAEEGMARFLAEHRSPVAGTTYVVSGDSVRVSLERLVVVDSVGGDEVYRLTARGVSVVPGRGRAVRTVRHVVLSTYQPLHVSAGVTSGVGVEIDGNAATLSGVDACGSADTVAGVAVPAGEYEGSMSVLEGDPPLDTAYASGADLLRSIGLDWDGVINEALVLPDVTVPGSPWPDYDTVPASAWPVIRVEQSVYSLGPGHSGHGTVIAEGDLLFNGSFQWRGLLLVGGTVESNGNQTVEGALVTGLNLLLGAIPEEADLGHGNKSFRYDACDADAASARAFRRLSVKPGTWREAI